MSKESEQLQEMFLKSFEEDVQDHAVRQIILHAIEVFSKKGLQVQKLKISPKVRGSAKVMSIHISSRRMSCSPKL